jgi:predicted DsbA family dithiol-disulfide isomerase
MLVVGSTNETNEATDMTLRVDIWSDIACPWCYVGKARFNKAVESFAHADGVAIRHRSFELDPNHPEGEIVSVTGMLSRKYGMSEAQAQDGEYRLRDLAAAEGLEYQAEGRDHGSTFDMHRLLHLAADRGRSAEAWDAFYRANFAEPESVYGDSERLVATAVSAGLDEAEVREVLADPERYRAEVRADEAEAARLGATGVPFFVIDGRYGISGAQPTELFAQALERAWNERAPKLQSVGGDAEACGPDGCAI